MRLLVASANTGKVREISHALHALPIDVVTPGMLALPGLPEETASTIAENALLKARYYRDAGLPTVGDDSGIFVEALPNELGVKTRRWGLGASAPDDVWIAHFLKRMAREENKRAQFVCVLAYIDTHGHEHLFEGVCDGRITTHLESDFPPGLPFDGCFIPDGYESVMGMLTIDQKNSTSHRGRALSQFSSHMAEEYRKWHS